MEYWIVVLAVWLFYEWRKRRSYQRKNDERFALVISNLDRIDRRIDELKELPVRVAQLEKRPAEPLPTPVPAAPTATALPPAQAPKEPPRAIPPSSVFEPVPLIPLPPLPPPDPRVEPPRPATNMPSIQPPPPRPAQPPSIPSAPPVALGARPGASAPTAARRKAFEIEEKLGQNWLNKIGIVALVIGIALFLAYKFPSLSNPGKVGLGYAVSLSLLGTGVFLERRDRYRIFARALIGGGWALTFFSTYAMHFVKYTQVIETQSVDLVLLFIVAAMMVAHTLRYDSQVVTGLAFLLAFTTVAISQDTVYSLGAGAILAIGLVAIVRRRSWFELEIFGLLASYLNHYHWLRTVVEPMGGKKHMFQEFVPSLLLLVFYWVVFRWSYIARRIQNENQERVSTLAALLNTSFLLALMKYQAIQTGLAFYALLILGVIEMSLAQLPVTRRRRAAFVILTTIGVTLVVAAVPFKFAGTQQMSIIWLAQAEALFLAGVFTRDVLFRRFGLLAALLTSGNMLYADFGGVLRLRTETHVELHEFGLALSFLVAALLLYFNSHWISRRRKDLLKSDFEAACFRGLSYVAGLLLIVSVWLEFPGVWAAVAWSVVALILTLLGLGLDLAELSNQAHAFAGSAFVWVLLVNRLAAARYLSLGVTQRFLTISLVVALLYVCACWAGKAGGKLTAEISETYTTGAAFLVALVAFYECHWAATPVAWVGIGLTLAILGRLLDRRDLSYQAHALAAAAFVRTLLVNLDATQQYSHMTLRLITFSLVAVLLYLCARFSGPRESDSRLVFSAGLTWAGSILVGVLAYKELPSAWIVVGWAAFALLLLVLGSTLERVELHYQADLLAFASVTQALLVNLRATEPLGLIQPRVTLRLVTVLLTSALLYLSSRWARKGTFANAVRVGDAYTWGGSLLISLLMWYELRPLNVALAWVLLGLVLFEIGFVRKSVSWRLQAYVAMVSAFARIFFVNINAHGAELLITTLPLALVFYYAYARLQGSTGDSLAIEQRMRAASFLNYIGSVTLAAILRFWLDTDWVVAGWAGLAFIWLALAWHTGQDIFLHQGFLAAGAVLFRAGSFDFLQPSHPASGWFDSRSFQMSTAAGLLLASLVFALPLRKKFAARSSPGRSASKLPALLERPEQVFFFAPLAMLTYLIAKEVPEGRVTVAWGIEAVIVFLLALWVGQRSFRVTGLGLLLLCVGKIVILDVWRQEKSDRFVTFIILGVALLLVSFLYTRYSEVIKRYL